MYNELRSEIMKIPKKFKMFNHEITVTMNDMLRHNQDYMGVCKQRELKIEIDPTLSKTYKEQTFLHELTHMILGMMGEETLNSNEKFVNTFSELWYQAIESMKY
jgi:hypothetical protein